MVYKVYGLKVLLVTQSALRQYRRLFTNINITIELQPLSL